MSEPLSDRDVERPFDALRPAAPSPDLMARLRAARPSTQGSAAALAPLAQPPTHDRWQLALAGAAAVVVASLVWLNQTAKSKPPLTDPADVATRTHHLSPAAPQPAPATTRDPATGQTHQASITAPIFLPVETNRYLVGIQPATTLQRPDEAPRRLLRAVVVDDMTAVGAETDSALHLRRAREVYLPLTSPVY